MERMTRSYLSQILGLSQPSCSRMPRQSSIPVCHMACRPRTQIRSTRTCSLSSRVSNLRQLNNKSATKTLGDDSGRNDNVFQSLSIHQATRCDYLLWEHIM